MLIANFSVTNLSQTDEILILTIKIIVSMVPLLMRKNVEWPFPNFEDRIELLWSV